MFPRAFLTVRRWHSVILAFAQTSLISFDSPGEANEIKETSAQKAKLSFYDSTELTENKTNEFVNPLAPSSII